jgi:hypothetical protein
MKKIKFLLLLAMLGHGIFVSAQWQVDNSGNFSTIHDVEVFGTFTYSNFSSLLLKNAGLAVPNGDIFTKKFMGVGTNAPMTRLTVQDGSFLLHMAKNSGFNLNADFDLGEIGTRFSFNAYRNIFRGGEITFAEFNNDRGSYSFAFGKDPKASGQFAVSLGNATSASGHYSFAIGNGSIASGTYSSAMGNGSVAGGDYSFAVGNGSTAKGIGAVAMGGKSSSSGTYATALGSSSADGNYSLATGTATAGGDFSVALNRASTNGGDYSTAINESLADGDYSFATGVSYTSGQYSAAFCYSQADADYSIAGGYLSGAYGINSIAFGTYASAVGKNSIALGSGIDSAQPFANKIDNSLMIGFNSSGLPSVFVGPADPKHTEVQFGFVGIGTTTPKHELSVNGTVLAKNAVVVENLPGEWPDYVFAKKYPLMPLNEIEKFIEANHHLPGVPTQDQIRKEGLNLGGMEMIMMQKIEELTLHMIQLEKENDSLKDQVKEILNRK